MENNKKYSDFAIYLSSVVEEIINDDFTETEKNEWEKCMVYYHLNIPQLCHLIEKVINYNPHDANSSNIEFGLSEFNKELYSGVIVNKKMINNFNILVYRISLIFQSKINLEFLKEGQTIEIEKKIVKLQNDTLLLGNRYGLGKDLVITNHPSFRTFNHNKLKKFNFTILFNNLKSNGFLKSDVDILSFEMVFSQSKINSQFKKLSWIGSLYEIDHFINQLFLNNVLLTDINYKYTIVDCFYINDKVINYNQLYNPKGRKTRLYLIENSISKSVVK